MNEQLRQTQTETGSKNLLYSLLNNKGVLVIVLILTTAAALGVVASRRLVDFPVYYAAGQSLISGRTDLYSPMFALSPVMDYRYLPFFLVSLVPLWHLSFRAAAYVWYFTELIEIAVAVWAVRGMLKNLNMSGSFEVGSEIRTRTVWLLAFLITCQYFVMVVHYGNAQLVATALMFAAMYLWLRQRNLVAGALLALSITIKLIPILLLPYFILRKQWRVVGTTGVFIILANLAPAAYFGARRNSELIKEWYHHVIENQEFHEINGPINLSLKGQLQRLLTRVPYSERVDGDTSYPQTNIVNTDRESLRIIWLLSDAILVFLALLFLFASGFAARGSLPSDSPSLDKRLLSPYFRPAMELSLMTCLMVLADPLTSKIYFIALLWPAACIAWTAYNNSGTKGLKAGLVVAAVMNFVLPLLPGRSTQRLLLVLGPDFYLTLFLAVTAAWALFRFGPRSAQFAAPQTQDPLSARTP